MSHDPWIAAWQREEQEPFTGWDFSYLEGRMQEDLPPWSYAARAAELMQQASSVLDLGTGGGERLLQLKPYWPTTVVATEEYPPNVHIARQRLLPAGAQVVEVSLSDDALLPFPDAAFDLVLNRHSGFNSAEVARTLTPGGTFLTQQVHGLWAHDLLAAFDATPQWPDATPEHYVPRLQQAGLAVVTVHDWSGTLTFADVGAIVYYLKAIPWLIQGFSVTTHAPYLRQLQHRRDRGEPLVFTAKHYLMEARKPTLQEGTR
jgi:SAM-dependent methyltransferase